MNSSKSILLIPLILLMTATTAFSQANAGDFGAGVILGEPSGLSAKLWTSHRNAFDFGIGWAFEYQNSVHMNADYLWHNFNALKVNEGQLPIFYGIGARLTIGNVGRLGVRIPVGVNYLFEKEPIGVFFEVAPILDLAPSTQFDANAGIGIRYYFSSKR